MRSNSRAQAHLEKILLIIESVPSRESQIHRNGGFVIDLDLRLGLFAESGGSDSASIGANREPESEVTNLEAPSSEIGENGGLDLDERGGDETASFPERGEGCLDLLVEAARLVSGGFGESGPGGACRARADGASPAVRTRRGRSQVIPYRYRDSVLEPWKLSQSALVSAKRRSRR